MTQPHDDFFSAKLATAGPLVITFILSSTVSITTTVTGDSRQYATVAIAFGSVTLWSSTLTQFDYTATIPNDLIAGPFTIKKGSSFVLQIPTTLQYGSIDATLTVASPLNPDGTPFAATIASWPLMS